eukprot:3994550-Pleurochrysis_carterae.AAC.5
MTRAHTCTFGGVCAYTCAWSCRLSRLRVLVHVGRAWRAAPECSGFNGRSDAQGSTPKGHLLATHALLHKVMNALPH